MGKTYKAAGYVPTTQIVPQKQESPWGNAIKEMSDDFYRSSLLEQQQAIQQQQQTERWNREDARELRRNQREDSELKEKRAFDLSEEERQSDILSDPTTPEGERYALLNEKTRADIEKSKRTSTASSKMPQATKMRVDALYNQRADIVGEDEEAVAARKKIDKQIAKETLAYDPGLRKRLETARENKADEDAKTAVALEDAEIEKRMTDMIETSTPEFEAKLKMYQRYIDSGINVERYQSLKDEMLTRRENAK